jgi:hypothetical protein
MNTRSSKEYRYIFTTTWKQESTSHLSSRLTDNESGKLLIIFILAYLFVLPTSFLRIPKTHNHTSLQVWHANVLHFCSFCKPTIFGATREWDALYLCNRLHEQVISLYNGLHVVEPTEYPDGQLLFPGGTVTGAANWPPSRVEVKNGGAVPLFTQMSSRRGA